MPVKLKQWHYAQAPLPWHTTLSTLRLLNAHLKALSLTYNNLTINSDDPIPSLPQIHTLYDQIIAFQKRYIAAREELAVVSEELGYFEDPDRMTWITRPDRRRYECESDEGKEEERGRKDEEQRSVTGLSEVTSGISIEDCSSNSDNGSGTTSDNDSDSNTSTSSTYPPTPPPSPPISTSTLEPKTKPKHVHFAKLQLQPHRDRGVNRIRTREEVEEEFQAANTLAISTFILQDKSPRKRKRDDEDWDRDWDSDRVGSVRKKVKMWHSTRWPEAYYEDV